MRVLKFALGVLMFGILAGVSHAQSVPLASGEWAPFTGEKLQSQGVCSEITRAAFKAGGMSANIGFYPWARAEAMVKGGEAFATFPYAMTEERKSGFSFSEPIILAKSKIFYYEGMGKPIEWSSLADFKKYKMGGVQTYWYTEALAKSGIAADLTTSSEQAFKMLQAGRIEYLIENELVGLELIKSLFPGDTAKFKTLAKPYDESPFFLMVSRTYPNSAEVLKKFNDGLAAIRADGSYQAILAKFGVSG